MALYCIVFKILAEKQTLKRQVFSLDARSSLSLISVRSDASVASPCLAAQQPLVTIYPPLCVLYHGERRESGDARYEVYDLIERWVRKIILVLDYVAMILIL